MIGAIMFGYFVFTSFVMRPVCLIAIWAFLSSALYNDFCANISYSVF